jgi:prevent-host-death family protein
MQRTTVRQRTSANAISASYTILKTSNRACYHVTNIMTNSMINQGADMTSVNLAEAKAQLSALVSKAEKGEETIIMRRGEAVARLVPMTAPKQCLRSRREFRSTLPQATKPSAVLIREARDEGY